MEIFFETIIRWLNISTTGATATSFIPVGMRPEERIPFFEIYSTGHKLPARRDSGKIQSLRQDTLQVHAIL